ncbi:MAG TPA: hypothetical protein VNV87_08475 [Acidimicrobiales bacterium]|jgi:hypothetical protein|nr:hypothetical protein [Acidimicrobiales bacterium]
MTATNEHLYQRGISFDIMPIAPVPEHCVAVEAGPATFVVESRLLTDAVLRALPPGSVDASGTVYDDYGATVHVCDGADDVEYLRFDCFESEPHYHYINSARGENLICRIDEVAEGDPIEWTVGRLRDRLPEMLDLAGGHQLAGAVRAAQDDISSAIDRVAELLRRAQVKAAALRGSAKPTPGVSAD